jgi:hypothetical protein
LNYPGHACVEEKVKVASVAAPWTVFDAVLGRVTWKQVTMLALAAKVCAVLTANEPRPVTAGAKLVPLLNAVASQVVPDTLRTSAVSVPARFLPSVLVATELIV